MSAPADLPLQRQLAETERWPAATLRAQQFQQLGLLVEHALRTVPYWRPRFAAAGIAGAADVARHWEKLPPLTRREVQQAGPALRSAAVPASHGMVFERTTSGATATPVTVANTALDQRFFKAVQLRTMLWHGFDFARSFVSIRMLRDRIAAYPQGLSLARWGDHEAYPFATGPAAVLNIGASVAQQIEWLRRQRVDYLMTMPTNLAALVDTFAASGLPPLAPAKIITFAETLRPELRALCRDAWGAEIVDIYSAQEVGYIAAQCPRHEHYHLLGEHVLAEILDDDGRPCAPGAVGRVVVTALRNFAMPLFRYEIGDYAERGHDCDCGRTLPVLARILGRARNMLVTPDGQRYFPFFGATGFRRAAPLVQYQFVQTSPMALEARIVAERDLTPAEEAALTARVHGVLAYPFRITFKRVAALPRAASGKFEDFISEVVPS